MGTLKTNSSLRFAALAAIGVGACAGAAQATDLAPYVPPAPVETWTGFSVGVGGGVEFLDADVNAKASRKDEFGECHTAPLSDATLADFVDAPCDEVLPPFPPDLIQEATSNLGDLDGTGGFLTVQGAYDYQFAPRWLAGAFVDADWSDTDAHARRTQTSSQFAGQQFPGELAAFDVGTQKTTIDTELSTDWRISVGGRIGWLATPRTLLYFLAAYTHQDLSDARVRINISDPIQLVGTSASLPTIPTNLLVELPDSLDGFSLGGGGEAKLGGPWSVKFEYRWTHLEGGSGHASSQAFHSAPISLEGTNGSTIGHLGFHDVNSQASADFDLDLHTVRAVLTYHFWSSRGYGG